MNVLLTPAVVLAILSWLAAPAHSLGEAAQKEAFRRHLLPQSKVSVTGAGQPTDVFPVATPPQAEPPSSAVPAGVMPPAGMTPPASAADHTTDESWWRKRISDARTALANDQSLADGLQTRINGLQRDVVNIDDPARQAKLRTELTKALADLEKAKKQVADDQAAIKGIQDEARRLDVPAGWIR